MSTTTSFFYVEGRGYGICLKLRAPHFGNDGGGFLESDACLFDGFT